MEVYGMTTMLPLGIFAVFYGICGLFGLQIIPKHYQKQKWTEMYIHSLGVSWLLLGILWVIGYLVGSGQHWAFPQWFACLILCSFPGFLHMIINEKKYRAM